MAALLIIPAAAARFWTERLWVMLATAGGVGLASGVVGVGVSAVAHNLAAGPLVALTASAFFGVSLLVAPRRGVLPAMLCRLALRRRVARQNLLRSLYELGESAATPAAPEAAHSLHDLALKRAWSPQELGRAVASARRRGLVEMDARSRVSLTPAGAEVARAVVRAHRLWELYLIEQADIPADHVDRDADAIEHVLPHDAIERLEEKLRRIGRLPRALPTSPHAIGASSAEGGGGRS
jgi:manganese/zinc/iron transport system permease protein